MSLSRRSFLKCVAAASGAAIGTRFAGSRGIEGVAHADAEQPALVMIYLAGGYNALFGSAGGLVGSFGVTNGNIEDLGNGLVIDAPTFGTLPTFAKTHMATLGVAHGITDHDDSQQMKWWSDGKRSYPLMLASALGGTAAIKAAIVGDGMPPGPKPPESGITLQTVRDMDATIAALGGAAADPRVPNRAVAAAAIDRSAAMSKVAMDGNPKSLNSLREAYPTAAAVLRKPNKPFSFADLSAAYGLNGATSVNDFKSRMAAAELMITSGTNVVFAQDDSGWDSHGDVDGSGVRNMMNQQILPGLQTFINRMMTAVDRNVVVCIMGDFARSLPGSDHQPNCAVTVMGKYVKTGSTGRVNANVDMAAGTPDILPMWSYLASVLKVSTNPFGKNPHALVLP
jgi:hypothetical protein